MGRHIKLVNMTDVMKELGAPHMGNEEVVEWLTANLGEDAEFFSISLGNKGGRVMIRADDAEALRSGNWDFHRQRRRSPKAGEEIVEPRVVERVVDRLDPAWKAEIEGMVLENDRRIDELHKAVIVVTDVYDKLRQEVDPSRQLPEPPSLPPRYAYKVLIVGMDDPSMARIRANFRTINFQHWGGSRSENAIARGHNIGKNFDLVVCMISYSSHSLREGVERRFGKDKITYVKGSQSSLESVLALWLTQKEREKT